MNNKQIADNLILQLKIYNIDAAIFKVADTGSVYVHFTNPKLGKLRVGDHNEKKDLGYRWQIRTDITDSEVKQNKGHNQFFYPVDQIPQFLRHIRNYYNKIIKID